MYVCMYIYIYNVCNIYIINIIYNIYIYIYIYILNNQQRNKQPTSTKMIHDGCNQAFKQNHIYPSERAMNTKIFLQHIHEKVVVTMKRRIYALLMNIY